MDSDRTRTGSDGTCTDTDDAGSTGITGTGTEGTDSTDSTDSKLGRRKNSGNSCHMADIRSTPNP